MMNRMGACDGWPVLKTSLTYFNIDILQKMLRAFFIVFINNGGAGILILLI